MSNVLHSWSNAVLASPLISGQKESLTKSRENSHQIFAWRTECEEFHTRDAASAKLIYVDKIPLSLQAVNGDLVDPKSEKYVSFQFLFLLIL